MHVIQPCKVARCIFLLNGLDWLKNIVTEIDKKLEQIKNGGWEKRELRTKNILNIQLAKKEHWALHTGREGHYLLP